MSYGILSYNQYSLRKHNVSEQEIDEVLDAEHTVDCELPDSRRGNQRTMLVGFTLQARLLEIGIEFLPDRDHVFHTDDATKRYIEEFERSVKP